MADELELHFTMPGPPGQALLGWKADPPPALSRFELVDEAYNSLTYERRYYDWPAYLVMITIVGLLLRSLMQSVCRLTVRFDEEGGTAGRGRVTIVGKADPATRAGLGEYASRHGGATGLRVGA